MTGHDGRARAVVTEPIMAVVPSPGDLLVGWQGVARPSLSNGSAHALGMSEADLEALEERAARRLPFGFQPPAPVAAAVWRPRCRYRSVESCRCTLVGGHVGDHVWAER